MDRSVVGQWVSAFGAKFKKIAPRGIAEKTKRNRVS
jgi:hypothetical protein